MYAHNSPTVVGHSRAELQIIIIYTASVARHVYVLCQPLVLRPTSCWKVDWDELEANQQNFHALSSLLHQQVCLLAHRHTDTYSLGDFTFWLSPWLRLKTETKH